MARVGRRNHRKGRKAEEVIQAPLPHPSHVGSVWRDMGRDNEPPQRKVFFLLGHTLTLARCTEWLLPQP